MLNVCCEEHLQTVKAEAKAAGRLAELEKELLYLGTYAENGEEGATRCDLFKDFAPWSFHFTLYKKGRDGEYRCWFNGGLIFHGSHDNGGDGGMPTLSVNLNAVDGWSVHT